MHVFNYNGWGVVVAVVVSFMALDGVAQVPGPLTLMVTGTDDVQGASCDMQTFNCPSLRAAVLVANTSIGATILMSAGTYRLTLGVLNITNSMTLVGVDANGSTAMPGTVVISANGNPVAFDVNSDLAINVAFNSLTIQDSAGSMDHPFDGYAITTEKKANVTLYHVILQNNLRGGIDFEGGSLLIQSSLISSCGSAGVTFSGTGKSVIRESSIVSNGTGVESHGPVTIVNSTIAYNKDAGIFAGSGVVLINDTIVGNLGVGVTANSLEKAKVSIQNSIFGDNGQDAGVYGASIFQPGEYYISSLGRNLHENIAESGIKLDPSDVKVALPSVAGALASDPATGLLYFPLLPGGVAVGKGICNAAPPGVDLTHDQLGNARKIACNVGAVEVAAGVSPYVPSGATRSTTTSGGDSTTPNPTGGSRSDSPKEATSDGATGKGCSLIR